MEQLSLVFKSEVVLCCCLIVTCTTPNPSGSTASTTTQQNTTQTIPTPSVPTTTEKSSGTIDIPKFDFSVFDHKKPEKKSAIADIPTIDFSKKSKPDKTKSFCQINICKLMDGLCRNNSRCVPLPPDCDTYKCICNNGLIGQVCDKDPSEVIKAKEVPTVNGKIVTTETPKVTTTNSNALNESSTVSINNGSTGIHDHLNPAEKYKQPKGSFRKGPEVPTPSSEKPIKINVKSQKIRGKSTTIIEQPSASVTVATVSLNLEQSLSGDVSGQTTKKQEKKKKRKGVSDSRLKGSKNVERVFLTSGKVKIIDQSVTPLDMTAAALKRKETKVN